MKKHFGTLFVILGIIIISIPFIGRYIAARRQQELMDAFLEESSQWSDVEEYSQLNDALVWGALEENQSEIDAGASLASENLETSIEVVGENGEEEINRRENDNLGTSETISKKPSTVAVLSIDKINVYLPVAEGTDTATLNFALGHMPGSANVGAVGNCVIAGHRGHSFGTYFSRLDEMVIGDTIKVSQGGKTYNYEVYETKIVEPDDLSVLKGSSNYRVLTLITCHPMYTSTHRLIVHAVVKE